MRLAVTAASPSVTINGAPSVATANTPVVLTSTVNEPDPSITPSTYAWSVVRNNATLFTGTSANFTFTPALNGVYTVNLLLVTLDTVRPIAETGVDAISIGALTHSVRALDISLEVHPCPR